MGCFASGHNFYHMHEGNSLATMSGHLLLPRCLYKRSKCISTCTAGQLPIRGGSLQSCSSVKSQGSSKKPTLAPCLRLNTVTSEDAGRRRVCSPNSSPGCQPPAFQVRKSCEAIPSCTSRITLAAPEIAGELAEVGSHKDTEPTLTLARLAHLHARFALADKERRPTTAGNLNASRSVCLRCYQLLGDVLGYADSSPVKAGLHTLMWNLNWVLRDVKPCAVAAVSQVALTASA